MIRGALFKASISLLALSACHSCNDKALDASGDGGHQTSAQLTSEQSAKVLARVGDVTITLGDFVAALEHMDEFDRLRYQSPERRKELLNEMIDVELLAHEATAKGYDQDPVAQQELRTILRDALLKDSHKGLPGPNDVSEADVHAYYEAHKAEFKDPERRRFSLIVMRDEATANANLDRAKQANAAQWGQLVRELSTDSLSKSNVPVDLAGDFGMVSPPGDSRGENPRIPNEVRAAGFEIAKVGDVLDRVVKAPSTDPKNPGDRFYLIRFSQKADEHERSLAEAERMIRVKISQEKTRAKDDELLASLRTQFPIQIDDNALAQVQSVTSSLDAGLRD